MANKYYKLDVSTPANHLATFKSALIDKYGDGVTFLSETIDSDYIRLYFSCHAISHRVIYHVFHRLESSGFWTCTDTNKTDLVSVSWGDVVSLDERLILGDSFLMFASSSVNNVRRLCIIGKTEGGKNVFCGFNSRDYSGRVQDSFEMEGDSATRRDISIVSTSGNAMCEPGVPLMSNLMFAYSDDGNSLLMYKDDGTIDTIKGLYMTTYSPKEDYGFLLTNKGFLSPRSMTSNGSVQLLSSIVAEL